MPSKSKKQHDLMVAVANNPKFAKKIGIPQSVGKDYEKADEGKKFKRGGKMSNCGTKRMKKGGGVSEYGGKETYKSEAAMKRHEAKESPAMERREGMAMGGKVRGYGMARGGKVCKMR